METLAPPPELAEGVSDPQVALLPPAEAPQEPALLLCAVCGMSVEHSHAVQTWLGPGRVGWRHVGCSPLGVIEAGLVEREETEPIPYRVVEDETERKQRAHRFSF